MFCYLDVATLVLFTPFLAFLCPAVFFVGKSTFFADIIIFFFLYHLLFEKTLYPYILI